MLTDGRAALRRRRVRRSAGGQATRTQNGYTPSPGIAQSRGGCSEGLMLILAASGISLSVRLDHHPALSGGGVEH